MKQIALILTALSGIAFAVEPPAHGTVPEGLAASDWSGIRAAYEAGRHAVHAQENGSLVARNPGQQWRTEFDGKGFTVIPDHGHWIWGLELTGYGERALVSTSSSIGHHAGKITCQRDENLEEWFVNDIRGLEQGWSFIHRPQRADSSAPLLLHLSTRGSLSPLVSPDGSCVSFEQETGGTALTYGGLKAWDADGKVLVVRFEQAGENRIRIAIEDRGARYPVTIDPIAQQAYLKASNAESGDFFGNAVAVSGDTVIVGAFEEDSNATGVNGDQTNNGASYSGAAYIYTRSGNAWTQQAYLKASNTTSGDQFGNSVAISGDTVVVGTRFKKAVYVFSRSGTAWTQQAYLEPSYTAGGGGFGTSVAVSGDSIVVGARLDASNATGVNGNPADSSAAGAGAAYVFTRSDGQWTQQAYLKASNTEAGDSFGSSVAVSGDTVVVGAPDEDSNVTGMNGNQTNNNASDAGAAYVFTRDGTTWTQQAYVKASNTGAGDGFGVSVSISADTIVAGAPFEDSNATGVNGLPSNNSASDAGAAYVFTRSGTAWTQQAYLKASNTGASDQFGMSVAVDGDRIVAGGHEEDSNATGVNGDQASNSASKSGAAYVFTRSGTAWTQHAYLKASRSGENDNFGKSVAVAGDLVVAGADIEGSNATGVNGNPSDDSQPASGAAYVFDMNAVVTPPEIAIEQAGGDLTSGATKNFGGIVVGSTTRFQFTIFNTGAAGLALTGTPAISVTGSSDFTVNTQPIGPVSGPGGSMTFGIDFAPTSGGAKAATLSILNNDADESPFLIEVTGSGLAFGYDTDGDGLDDASEFNMAALGFNWQVSQTSLVNTYKSNANGAGYYSLSQVQALHSGTPLIARDPATGRFKLTMDWKKSTNLADFFDFAAPAGSGVSINPTGDVEFEFSVPDDAAFFRIEVE